MLDIATGLGMEVPEKLRQLEHWDRGRAYESWIDSLKVEDCTLLLGAIGAVLSGHQKNPSEKVRSQLQSELKQLYGGAAPWSKPGKPEKKSTSSAPAAAKATKRGAAGPADEDEACPECGDARCAGDCTDDLFEENVEPELEESRELATA